MSYLASWIDPVQPIANAWSSVALEATIKATALLLLALLASRLSRSHSAAGRHLIWATCIVTLLTLPALSAVLPNWGVRVPRVGIGPAPIAPHAVPYAGTSSSLEREAAFAARESVAREHSAELRGREFGPQPQSLAARANTRGATFDWTTSLFLIWSAGCLAVILWTLAGLVALARHARRAVPLVDGRWSALAHSLALELGIRRRPRLLISADIAVPMTCGVIRPTIILPADANRWSATRRRVVLLHELAHVKRHDCLAQLVAHVACGLYWFHPLAWHATARLRAERERACDDAVLRSGTVAEEYASQLLDMARSFRSLPAAALAMARPSQLEGRLLAILAPSSDRRALSRRLALPVVLGACSIALPVAAAAPVPNAASLPSAAPLSNAARLPNEKVAGARPAADSSGAGEQTRAQDIIFHPRPSDPLQSRLEWARQEAARRSLSRGYWIGYAVPASRGGRDMIASGSEGWQLDELKEPSMSRRLSEARREVRDAPAADLTTDSAAAILLRYSSLSSELARPAALKIRTLAAGVELEGRPVIWLGNASDDESLPFLTGLYAGASPTRMKKALVSSISVHRTSNVVVPFLLSVLESDAVSDIREQAAEGLAYHDTQDSLEILKRLATSDRSSRVRAEAVEALGEMRMPESLDALLELVKVVEGRDVRREAVEALGEKNSDRAAEALAEIAVSDGSKEVQSEAVETLGEVPEQRGLTHLLRLARSHPSADAREEVAETLGELPPSQQVLDELRRMAFEDAALSVQKEAVESIAEIDSDAANRLLEEIERDHPNPEVREEARDKRRG
ncbi:MAG TPA: M56 family metallopeptidase [Gemmatimonadaceae bacterium]|nr:M56 family metallopeptidase [Gemmatimonadaceae bacterium]